MAAKSYASSKFRWYRNMQKPRKFLRSLLWLACTWYINGWIRLVHTISGLPRFFFIHRELVTWMFPAKTQAQFGMLSFNPPCLTADSLSQAWTRKESLQTTTLLTIKAPGWQKPSVRQKSATSHELMGHMIDLQHYYLGKLKEPFYATERWLWQILCHKVWELLM